MFRSTLEKLAALLPLITFCMIVYLCAIPDAPERGSTGDLLYGWPFEIIHVTGHRARIAWDLLAYNLTIWGLLIGLVSAPLMIIWTHRAAEYQRKRLERSPRPAIEVLRRFTASLTPFNKALALLPPLVMVMVLVLSLIPRERTGVRDGHRLRHWHEGQPRVEYGWPGPIVTHIIPGYRYAPEGRRVVDTDGLIINVFVWGSLLGYALLPLVGSVAWREYKQWQEDELKTTTNI